MKTIIRSFAITLLVSYSVLSYAQRSPQRVKFQPEGCEFYVYFPKQPTIKKIDMAAPTGHRFDVIRAELSIPSENCYLRAEFASVPLGIFENIDDKTLIDSAHEFAGNDGWETPAVDIENNNHGKSVNVRAYKTVDGTPCTLVSKTYLGGKSMLILYAVGPSKRYPPSAAHRFFNSLGRSVANRSSENKKLEENKFLTHKDVEYLYSIWYPKTWETAPISHPQTRFKVGSGIGFEDFSINVVRLDPGDNVTPKEFVEEMMADDTLQLARSSFPDAVLITKGKDYLSNQEAFFYIFNGVYKAAGIKTPITVMQWLTVKYGSIYTLTFRVETERFDAMLPTYQKILQGFVFHIRK